ncbi:MAG: AAA family ATPase [Pirellulales bacterium]
MADDDLQTIETIERSVAAIREQVHRAIIGQETVIDQLLITLLAGGHALVVGVPGLAKTMVIQALARTVSLEFRRIQFTPDLMPSDITGTEIIQEDHAAGRRELRFAPGPIFGNMILADEINRTPPKTQAALLEAMQERQVTVGGQRHPVPRPFFVLATQNPIEQEGTYPLPEAQLDRFLLQIEMTYPTETDELEIIQRVERDRLAEVESVLSGDELLQYMNFVPRLPMGESLARYALRLVRGTRPHESDACDYVRQYVAWGVGPRAGQALVTAAKARAVMHGQPLVSQADLEAVIAPVLAHRLRPNFAAEADGVTAADILQQVVQHCRRQGELRESAASIPVLRSRPGR